MKKATIGLVIFLILNGIAFSQEGEQTTPTPEQYRAMIAKSIADLNVPAEAVSDIKMILINDSINLRIYYPSVEGPLPILFQMHGGCWVAGDLETHDNICRYLCNQAECIVVAIDYRQPPENRYPAAVNDCYSALQWIYKNAEVLGGDKCKIALIGDSSGGNLASALIITSENDESKDEAQLYHTQLLNAGVGSSLFEIKGIGHFAGLWAAGSDEVNEVKALVVQKLREL